jgi:hypothetical protein
MLGRTIGIVAIVVGLLAPASALAAKDEVESGIRSISATGKPLTDWKVEKGKAPDAADEAAALADEAAIPSGPVGATAIRSLQAISCKETYVTRTRNSSLGFLLWRYKHFVRWCHDGTKITTQPPTRTATATIDDAAWRYEGTTSQGWAYQYCCGHPYSGHYGLRRGHFTSWTFIPQTIKLSDAYPVIEIWVHADGTRCWRTDVSSGIKC